MKEDTPQESLEKLWQFIADAESEGFPYESHCGTGPVIFEDSGYDDVIREGATAIKEAGKRYVPHVAPYVSILYICLVYLFKFLLIMQT